MSERMADTAAGRTGVLDIKPGATPLREWAASIVDHLDVLWVLARKDFQVRYKRASLGVLWSVAVPLIQATVLAFVFSRLIRFESQVPFAPYVFSGVVSWGYFSGTLSQGATSIVDAAGLTDKVWFPRALLAIVPCLANLVGFAVSLGALVVIAMVSDAGFGLRILLLFPAFVLLFTFVLAGSLLTSALQVYFRDVRFLIAAGLMVWMYVTPILYPKRALGGIGRWLDFNPMTGIVELFHIAVVGVTQPWQRAVTVSVITTLVILVAGIELQRRHDRLFVDLL
jgi:lipopolysaccharide transport system permease protein